MVETIEAVVLVTVYGIAVVGFLIVALTALIDARDSYNSRGDDGRET